MTTDAQLDLPTPVANENVTSLGHVTANDRECEGCGKRFPLGKNKRKRCWSCIDGDRVNRESYGRKTLLEEATSDISMAVAELKKAHGELCAIAETGESGHRVEAMMIEPSHRVLLALGFLTAICNRMGWKEQNRDAEAQDHSRAAAQRRRRNANVAPVP